MNQTVDESTHVFRSILTQIGSMNVLAISGGRATSIRNEAGDTIGATLPVANGYRVEVVLDPSDTYTVRRVFKRGAKEWIKGEMSGVYNTELGEIAYQAHAFRSYEFGTKP